MSWSVARLGKAAAVRAKLAEDFAKINCSEPEQTVKSRVAEAVDAALAVFPTGVAVKVEASGSQWTPDSTKPEEKQNSAKLEITPLGHFTE